MCVSTVHHAVHSQQRSPRGVSGLPADLKPMRAMDHIAVGGSHSARCGRNVRFKLCDLEVQLVHDTRAIPQIYKTEYTVEDEGQPKMTN